MEEMRHKKRSEEQKKALLNRLKKAEGQIRGIEGQCRNKRTEQFQQGTAGMPYQRLRGRGYTQWRR